MPAKPMTIEEASAALEAWLAPDITVEAQLFEEMVDPAERRVLQLRKQCDEAQKSGEQDAIDWFIDEGTAAENLLVQVSDICLVAIYHWVERTAKTRLGSKLPTAKRDSSHLRGLNLAGIEAEFKKLGVDLSGLPGFTAVEPLRRFANSWKHDPSDPDERLCKELGLAAGRRGRSGPGYLSDDDLRMAMISKVGHAPKAAIQTAADVVRAYADVTAKFLKGLLRA